MLLFSSIIYAQEPLQTIIAKEGDGIYSILKKEGLHGVT